MDANRHFCMLARYNAWATTGLLDSVALLDEDAYRRDVGLFFGSIHGTLNHLLVGENHLWFSRFSQGVSLPLALDAELEPDRAHLDARLRSGAALWEPLIAAMPPERWADTLDYTTSRGIAASLPFAGVLAHVFNHSTHHRGQITAALTAMGQPCPSLDLAVYLFNLPTP